MTGVFKEGSKPIPKRKNINGEIFTLEQVYQNKFRAEAMKNRIKALGDKARVIKYEPRKKELYWAVYFRKK